MHTRLTGLSAQNTLELKQNFKPMITISRQITPVQVGG